MRYRSRFTQLRRQTAGSGRRFTACRSRCRRYGTAPRETEPKMKYLIWIVLLGLPCLTTNGLSLDELMRHTVDHNLDIQQAKLGLEQAMGRKIVLRSIAYPDAVIGAVLGDQGGHRAGESSNQPFGFGYGGFTQALFNAAIPASFRRADLEVLIAQQQLNVAVINQVHGARLAFYTAVYY